VISAAAAGSASSSVIRITRLECTGQALDKRT
jgi:hypothetical protein